MNDVVTDLPDALPELLSDALLELTARDLGYPDPSDDAPAYAENTLRGYRFDLQQLGGWCVATGRLAMPASPATVVAYLDHLDATGARRSTVARALAAIAHAHRTAGHTDPVRSEAVSTRWAALRATPDEPDHATPLLPPMLFDVVGACPRTRTLARRDPEPSLRGARDRALLLVGFVGALRRSEIVALHVSDIGDERRGLQLDVDGSPVVLVRSHVPSRCPVLALQRWLALSGIESGPVFRGVTKANRAALRALHPESVNNLVQQALERAGYDPAGYSAHSLRAGFVTYSQLLGLPDDVIATQTRHRSRPAVRAYARRLPDAS